MISQIDRQGESEALVQRLTPLTFHKGRVGLYAVLKALGIGPGDEVIVPGYTCVVVANAIRYLGATPIYADIDPETFNSPSEAFAALITARTRALVIQHTYGIPMDASTVCNFARERGLTVIEDCAHTIGSKLNGTTVGSFGDAAIFSSQWSKPVTTGIGGWVVINNPELLQRVHDIRDQFETCGWLHDISLAAQYALYRATLRSRRFWELQRLYRAMAAIGIGAGSGYYEETEGLRPPHYERKMSAWQERTLDAQLLGAAALDEHRRKTASLYDHLLSTRGIRPFVPPPGTACVLLRYPLRVADKANVLAAARKHRVEIGDWFNSPLHPQLGDLRRFSFLPGSCPHAEKAVLEVINLPTHTGIDLKEAERIVKFIDPFIRG